MNDDRPREKWTSWRRTKMSQPKASTEAPDMLSEAMINPPV